MRSLGLKKLSVVREAIKIYVYNRVSLRLGNLLQLTTTPTSVIILILKAVTFSMFSCRCVVLGDDLY